MLKLTTHPVKAFGAFVLCAMFSVGGHSDSTTKLDAIPAPEFSLPAIANAEGVISRAGYKGAVTYLDFWASWCGPCRLSLPALDEIYQELAPMGLKVTAISVDVVEEDAWDFLARYPVAYPIAIDTTGDSGRAFAVAGMPSGYLIDKKGMIREIHVGFRKGDEVILQERIAALLAESN